MIWQLVKFKIKTTFRKSAIISFIVIPFMLYFEVPFFLSFSKSTFPLAMSLITFDSFSQTEIHDYAIVGTIYIVFMFVLSNIFTPFLIQKSDVDFLYMLPLDEKEIAISQLVVSFLLNLLSLFFIVYILFPVVSFLSFIVMIMASIMNTFSYFALKRKGLHIIIAIWLLTSVLKFPFSPLSMLFGYTDSYFIFALLDVTILFLGIRNTHIEDLMKEFYKRQGLVADNKVVTPVSLYSSSSFIAMLKRSLNFIEIGGRINIGEMPYLINKRVKFYKVLIVTSFIALIYYISFAFFVRDYFLENFTTGLVGFFLVMTTSASALINEPLWLDLSAMKPAEFARKYLLAKIISLFILFLPISISNFLLTSEIGSLLIPFIFIYTSSIYAKYYPALNSQTAQYSLKNIIAGYLATFSLLPIYLDVFFPILGAITTLIFILPFLFSEHFWEKAFESAISNY